MAELSLSTKARYLLLGEWDNAGECMPAIPPDYLLDLAYRCRREANRPELFCDPREIARELGIYPVIEPVRGCYGELNEGNVILYSNIGGPRVWGLRVYHGIAHWLLRRRYGDDYEESDAWLLTIHLACPLWHLSELAEPELFLEESVYVPEWLVALVWDLFRLAA